MTRSEMWKEIVALGEWGLKEQFNQLSDDDISAMTVTECISKCYCMLMGIPFIKGEFEEVEEEYTSADLNDYMYGATTPILN